MYVVDVLQNDHSLPLNRGFKHWHNQLFSDRGAVHATYIPCLGKDGSCILEIQMSVALTV